mgnify:CR=1 FL=1
MILSCVMLCMHFCSWFWKLPDPQIHVQMRSSSFIHMFLGVRPPPQPPPIFKHVKQIVSSKDNNDNIRVNLNRLALLSSLNVMHSLPKVHSISDEHFSRYIKSKCAYNGFISPSLVKDPLALKTLKA